MKRIERLTVRGSRDDAQSCPTRSTDEQTMILLSVARADFNTVSMMYMYIYSLDATEFVTVEFVTVEFVTVEFVTVEFVTVAYAAAVLVADVLILGTPFCFCPTHSAPLAAVLIDCSLLCVSVCNASRHALSLASCCRTALSKARFQTACVAASCSSRLSCWSMEVRRGRAPACRICNATQKQNITNK